MNRPVIRKMQRPGHISEYPTGPCFDAGCLVTDNAGWRTDRPVIEHEKCNGCFYCYLCCPEGVIFKSGGSVQIDYGFCKGCGICARVCKGDAIRMIREVQADAS